MFLDFVVFDFVPSVLAKSLAGKSLSEMTCFVLNETKLNQPWSDFDPIISIDPGLGIWSCEPS